MEEKKEKRVLTIELDDNVITGVRPRDHVEDTPQEELAPLLAERYGASPEGMQKEVSRFYAELAAY